MRLHKGGKEMEVLHECLNVLVNGAILLFEFVGAVVIIAAGLRGVME